MSGEIASASIDDTMGFKDTITIPVNSSVSLIGLITNPRPGINLEAQWEINNEKIKQSSIDTVLIGKHIFSDTGHFKAFFTIQDQMGNSLKDSVALTIAPFSTFNNKISVDSLLLPIDGQKNLNPDELDGILFAWRISRDNPHDTVFAQLLLSRDSLNFSPIASGITDQYTSIKKSNAIGFGTTYFWRIAAKSNKGAEDTSKIFKFSTLNHPLGKGPSIHSILQDTSVFAFDSVSFFAVVIDSSAVIAKYEWDFDGNGVFDYISDQSALCKHAYSDTGKFRAIFKTIDSDSFISIDSVIVTVIPPKPIKKWPKITGIRADTAVFVSDTVAFFATALDSSAPITGYAWDFDGDGTFDYQNSSSAACNHVYKEIGTYKAVVRAIDRDSIAAYDTALIMVVLKETHGGPFIWNRRGDTTVTIFDTMNFSADALDSAGSPIIEYSWDFDGDGAFDYTSESSASCKHAYDTKGIYQAIIRVTDQNGKKTSATVKISVAKLKLKVKTVSRDTVVDSGATIRSYIAIKDSTAGSLGKITFEIDTANGKNYRSMKDSGASASFSFNVGAVSEWDSVKMRAYSPTTDTLVIGYKVDIRPRKLVIGSIDSTTKTIKINWSKTQESDFKEYRLYRSLTQTVDSNSELVKTTTDADIDYFISAPSYTLKPAYYRVYQVDKEGIISSGSNIVYGYIKNTAPTIPFFVTPSKEMDSMWSNSVIRWSKSVDSNENPITYDLLVNKNNAGFVTLARGITDTFFQLNGLDTNTFHANFRIIAADSREATASSDRNNILCKQVRMELASGWGTKISLSIIPKGSFVDSAGYHSSITYDYFMQKTEVTQLLYREVTLDQNGGHINPSASQNDAQPVETVTWRMALLYCNSMSKKCGLDTAYTFTGISWEPGNPQVPTPRSLSNLECHFDVKGFRLATEDEWEMAARGGKNYSYATDDGSLSCAKANYGACNNSHPIQVGSFPANPYGIQDLTGNVFEWCWDDFTSTNSNGRVNGRTDYKYTSQGGGPGPGPGNYTKVIRGGGYNDKDTYLYRLSNSHRAGVSSTSAAGNLGFRCVVPIKQWETLIH